MKYFPILDPFDDLRLVAIDRSRCELSLFLEGAPRGLIRLYYRELSDVLDCFRGERPVAELDIFEPMTHWLVDDYKKPHVIGDDGALYNVADLA